MMEANDDTLRFVSKVAFHFANKGVGFCSVKVLFGGVKGDSF